MFKWEQITFSYINQDKKIYEKLRSYTNLVLEKNKEFNLTNFDEESIWLEGIYQSIYLLDKFIDRDKKSSLVDIGAGAGFPSIPYLIFNEENVEVTIYEPIKKRCNFLELVKMELNLSNLTIINKRIEDDSKLNEHFDYITARAVMPLNMLIEVSSRAGKINSQYIFLKSKNAQQELDNSKWIISQLGIKDIKINHIELNDDKTHNIISYSKTKSTPNKIPRKWSEIKKDKLL